MSAVFVKTSVARLFGSPGKAAEFLDLFLKKAGVVKNSRWEARLEGAARCQWDSPPVRVVGYKNGVVVLRVKPSLNAAVDYLARLLIPCGAIHDGETVYRRLRAFVPAFNRFARTPKRLKNVLPPMGTTIAASESLRRKESQELADARRRLEANRQRRRRLQSELKMLDEEFREITKLLLAEGDL